MCQRKRVRRICKVSGSLARAVVLAGLLAVGRPPACWAQAEQNAPTAAAAGDSLAEVTVTATRRDTNLQSTPVAVSAIDEATITRAAPRDIGDLSLFVPNFSAATITSAREASFAMRGVSVNNQIVYYEAPIAVLVDDFVYPSIQTQLLDTFDIAQMEVLHGPQGTLFGKNTTGGAITIRTKRPSLTTSSFDADLSYGSFNEYNLKGAANLVLVPDTLGVRVVAGYDHSDGYLKNGFCYGPVTPLAAPGSYGGQFAGATGCGDGADVNGLKIFNGRLKVLFAPTENLTALLQYEILRDHSPPSASIQDTPPGDDFLFNQLGVGGPQNPLGNNPLDHAGGATMRTDSYIDMEHWRVDVDGAYLNVDFHMDRGTISDITGYRYQRTRLPTTTTGDGAIVADNGTVLSLFDLNRADDRKTFQQELRFTSNLGGRFDFVSGVFYQHEDIEFCVAQLLGFEDLAGASTPYGPWNTNPYVLCNTQRSDSAAVYTEGTFKFTDALSLVVGARYSSEHKVWQGRQQAFVQDIVPGATWRDIPLMQLANFSKYGEGVVTDYASTTRPTWRVSPSYQFTPEIFGYLSYSRGFKGGDFNDQTGGGAPFGNNLAAFQAAATATKPETADSYEIGIKSESSDHRVRINADVFYVKYKDLQKEIVVPLVVAGQSYQLTRFFNAASADVKGIEAELTAIPVKNLTVHANAAYQDGGYNSYETPIPAGYDLATAPLDRTPKWQGAVDVNYDVPLPRGYLAFVDANIHYTGKNLDSQSIVSPDQNAYLEANTVTNASIGVNFPDDRYSVRLIGRNLTNRFYRTATQTVGGLWTFSSYAQPRSWTLEARMNF